MRQNNADNIQGKLIDILNSDMEKHVSIIILLLIKKLMTQI